MLTRLYIDNYKCLTNLDLKLAQHQLFLGRNGSGKSCVFEALDSVVRLVRGDLSVSQAFRTSCLTRWENRSTQTIELDLCGTQSIYRYHLEVEHDRDRLQSRIAREWVREDNRPLFSSERGEAQLYRDDGSVGPKVLVDWSRSSLPSIQPRPENRKLTAVREHLARTILLSPNPRTMGFLAQREESWPARDLSNFVSWYRHLLLEQPADMARFAHDLGEWMPGLQSLRFVTAGESSGLVADWGTDSGNGSPRDSKGGILLTFDELSDGQRVLVALGAAIYALGAGPSTLLLDEPDNYLALQEVQPLLRLLRDKPDLQSLIASHHPEVINDLATSQGIVFDRPACTATRWRHFEAPAGTLLTPAEIVARGEVDAETVP